MTWSLLGGTAQNMAARYVVGAFHRSSPALLAQGLRVAALGAVCVGKPYSSKRLSPRAFSSDAKPPPGELMCVVGQDLQVWCVHDSFWVVHSVIIGKVSCFLHIRCHAVVLCSNHRYVLCSNTLL